MLIGDIDKQPAEVKRVSIDYSQWLRSGESLTGIETILPDGIELFEPASFSAAGVVLLVAGGEDQTDYLITMRAQTSLMQVKETELLVRVLEEH